MPKKQSNMHSELVKVTRKYNRMIWQLKGTIACVKCTKAKTPASPFSSTTRHENALLKALDEAQNHLEFCEYLVHNLSRAHRDAIKKEMQS